MTKEQQQQYREQVLALVYSMLKSSRRIVSYKQAVAFLNMKEIKTLRDNMWTEKRLFRFLQNAGYSGLWGLSHKYKETILTK
jgi:hypothetical protein